MQQSPFFMIVAIVSLMFGVAFLLIPDQLATWYGAAIDDNSRHLGRLFGSALVGLAIIYFMARDLDASPTLTGLLWAGLIVGVIELVLNIMATTSGLVNALGWVTVLIDVLLAVGFAYLLLVKPARM